MSYDVLIAGCGPTGATLANLLRAQGHKVAIFDRDTEIFRAPRAMVIDPESCRVYQRMGVLERLEKEDAIPFLRTSFTSPTRKELVRYDFSLMDANQGHPPFGLNFYQPSLERMLREDFEEGIGVDCFLGYEVLTVRSEPGEAVIETRCIETGEVSEFRGRFLVGADGGASLCRRKIGAKRVDFNYRRKWIVMDVIVHDDAVWNAIEEGSEVKCRPEGGVVFVKGLHNHLRFDFEIEPELADSFSEADAIELISEYIDTSSIEFMRRAPYDFYAGMPDIWRKDRILLAGDAAHQTSPFAGQGLNMGIRDAAHLSFLFDLVLNGKASDDLLDTYQEERWDHCAKVIKIASSTGLRISASGFFERLSRDLTFAMLNNFRSLQRKMLRAAQRWPLLSGGLIGEGNELCGARLIQPDVIDSAGARRKLDDVIGNGFVLLLPKAEASESIEWFKRELNGAVFVIGDDFEDVDGKLGAFLDGSAVLVRPDRYIVEAGASGSALCASFRDRLAHFAPDPSTTQSQAETRQLA